ncbi:MAG: NAD(+) synthase [Bacilli bacterium]|nr:NAD(+) synthase [Bacilli bacterium]
MYKFDAKKVKEDLVKWVRDWFNENGNGCNAVIGISGGKDSTVTAALMVEALGKDRVIGVLMPNGIQADISDSKKVVEFLDIKNTTVNIKDTVDAETKKLKESFKELGHYELSEQTIINLSPRIRMATLYAISQSVNGRVINTCNLSEDWVGYSTRYGDSAGDVSPLANLTVDEVKKLGIELGLPKELVYKTPSDGLCGKSDEDNLGFTYAILDNYLRTGICEDENIKNIIDRKHKINKFKLELMPSFKYGEVKIEK